MVKMKIHEMAVFLCRNLPCLSMYSIRSCQDTDRRLLMGELVEVKSSMKEQQGTSEGILLYSVTVILGPLFT